MAKSPDAAGGPDGPGSPSRGVFDGTQSGPVLLGRAKSREFDKKGDDDLDESSAMLRGDESVNGIDVVVKPASSGETRKKRRGRKEEVNMTRLDTFDGLRGLGALLVVAYHLRFGVPSAWINIGLFFGLSGLLMTSKVLQIQGRKGEFSIRHFWRTRILRLIPALLAVVLVVLGKSVAEWCINGWPGSTDLYYMRNDLIYAVFYGENWNLVNEQEDYFADTKKASVVRHVWSLSIEEQYYILWPIIFAAMVKLAACCVPAEPAGEGDVESGDTSVMAAMLKPDVRNLVRVLCFFEVAAIVFSQAVCVWVYRTRGETAAYFSTYSRAGEFAVGGLSACLLHISPWSLALFTRDPDRPPMTKSQRVGLEIASAVTVLSILGCSLIPLPSSELLEMYFEWFRLPFTTLVLFGGSLQSLQTSEPLPSWAIFTKFTRSNLLVYFGTTSYGLYLIHWVLIIWFGDSEINTIHSSWTPQGRQDGLAPLGRDVLIFAASIAVSGLSFWYFERVVMIRAAHLKPVKVIAIAFASMFAVAGLVWVATQGAVDPNTVETIQDQIESVGPDQSVSPTQMLFLGDSQAKMIADMMRTQSRDASADESCTDIFQDRPWGPTVINGGKGGEAAIQVFASDDCTWCEWHTSYNRKAESEAKRSVWRANAPYIFVMDNHFFRPWNDYDKVQTGLWGMEPQLKLALHNFIQYSAWHGAQHIFLSTGSPFHRMGDGETHDVHWENGKLKLPEVHRINAASRQRKVFREVLKRMRCKGEDDDRQRLLVSTIDYHKLVCPDFDPTRAERLGSKYKCNQRGPGGNKLKDDNTHPDDKQAGHYLVRQLQRVLVKAIGRQGSFFEGPFDAPLKCYDRMFGEEEEDYPTKDLLVTHEICVGREEGEGTKRKPVTLQHESAKVDLVPGKDVYMCRGLEMDKFRPGTGVTGLDVVKSEGSWKSVHQITYFSCEPGFQPPAGFQKSFPCTRTPFMQGCGRMVHTFGEGQESFRAPEGYMFPLDSNYTMLQVQFKAPTAVHADAAEPSLIDSTGVRLRFGRFLSTLQTFELGPRSSKMLSVPGRTERYAVQSVCSPDAMSAALESVALDEFEILGVHQHMHLAGVAMKTEVIHADGTSTPFGVVLEYDSRSQEMRVLPRSLTVSKDDTLKVTCVYNTKKLRRYKRSNLGVSALSDEACFSFLLTSPRVPLFNSCWHMQGQVDNRAFSFDSLAGLSGESRGDDECYSPDGESFRIPATTDVQGLDADNAKASVFQDLPSPCVGSGEGHQAEDEEEGERKHRKGKGGSRRTGGKSPDSEGVEPSHSVAEPAQPTAGQQPVADAAQF